jgi:hypothetical protein
LSFAVIGFQDSDVPGTFCRSIVFLRETRSAMDDNSLSRGLTGLRHGNWVPVIQHENNLGWGAPLPQRLPPAMLVNGHDRSQCPAFDDHSVLSDRSASHTQCVLSAGFNQRPRAADEGPWRIALWVKGIPVFWNFEHTCRVLPLGGETKWPV